jgi:osmotically-inducible protein OsmY
MDKQEKEKYVQSYNGYLHQGKVLLQTGGYGYWVGVGYQEYESPLCLSEEEALDFAVEYVEKKESR